MKPAHVIRSWGKVLRGHAPLLSIEITKECPLRCPGCYAYGGDHLGGLVTLREVRDCRGDELVEGILRIVNQHQPLHVSLVGGEPLVRHRELSKVLPQLSASGVHTMVVTSAVIPIPMEWSTLEHVTVAVSVDGLPQHHDVRRKPATYERILKNIAGRHVRIHWTITRQHMQDSRYLSDYLSFWNARPEVDCIWISLYSPQKGEHTEEMLTLADRLRLATELPGLSKIYPKLTLPELMAQAFLEPPRDPSQCLFSRMSVNYTADFKTRVEPCIFGGDPDCSQCGCSISAGLHGIGGISVLGPLKVKHLARGSIAIGATVNALKPHAVTGKRW